MATSRQFLTMVMALCLTCLGAIATAAVPPDQPYPWDTRSPKCRNFPELAATLVCAHEDWPTIEVTLERLTQLVSLGDYTMLDRALTEVSASDKRSLGGIPFDEASFYALYGWIESQRQLDPDVRWLARWKEQVPNSQFAPIAQAMFHKDQAWLIRGNGLASTVSPASWKLFEQQLVAARKALSLAPPASRNLPLWHRVLLSVSIDQRAAGNDASDVFRKAVARWPTYFRFYEIALYRLEPRWGGSWQLADDFINHWSRELATSEGDSMYARLYRTLIGSTFTPQTARMDWNRMKASFEDLVTRYPHPSFMNAYASYACMARDKEAYARASKRIKGDALNEDAWLSGYSPEACELWAASQR